VDDFNFNAAKALNPDNQNFIMKIVERLRVALRPVRRIFNQARVKLIELPYRLKSPMQGSPEWLIKKEVFYGGLVTDVARQKVSPLDTRSKTELAFWGMSGGDRMLHQGYASIYTRYLTPFLNTGEGTLAEFGILKGTGLAIWCDLFPYARILGLDIDPTHFESNRAALMRRGAFKRNQPEIYEYDQLLDGDQQLSIMLKGRTLDIVIDDGLHSVESILMTWRSVRPHLSPRFVYFIEDHACLLDTCGKEFNGFDARAFGLMTVISAGISLPSN
jgi:hypothetical protein